MKLLAMYFLLLLVLYKYKGGTGASTWYFPCSRYPCSSLFPEHILCVDCNNKNLVTVPSFPANVTKNIGEFNLDGNRITIVESGIFNGYSSLRLLSLKNNGISDVNKIELNGLQTLESLDLRNNEIIIIPEGALKRLQNVKILYLSKNKITNISKGTFNDLKILTEIHFDNNQIANLYEDVFNGLQRLTKLYLQNNNINSLPECVFDGLQSLMKLYLHNNKITSIPDRAFNGLQNLMELYLYNNQIANIPESAFYDLQSLTILYLSNNKIANIPESAFNGLQNLTKLYLHNNKITSIPDRAFNGLQNLMELHLDNNQIAHIPESAFYDLQSLTILYLSKNKIASIPESAFNDLQNLTKLYLHNNKITSIPDRAFNGLQNLMGLHLDNNQIANIPESAFNGLQSLTILYLNYNKIANIAESAFNGLQSLTKLYLHKNQITSIPDRAFNGLQNLMELHLDNNQIANIPESAFNGLQSLTILYLSHSKIANIAESAFNGLQRLTILYLNDNKIASVPESAFNGLQSLTRLYLDNNIITDLSEGAFNGLANMKWLDLSDNKIGQLHNDIFKGVPSLAILVLNKNKISHIQPKVFFPLSNLFRLYLQSNIFKEVPSALWTTRFSHVSLFIDNNPFSCSCKLLNELKQLRHKVKRLQPSTSFFEQQCTKTTSICEEERNFALGMSVGNNCPGLTWYDSSNFIERLETEYAATDDNLNSYGVCKDYESCLLTIRVDLPGVIVVTMVVVVVSSPLVINGTITIAVGDKLSDAYEECNKFPLTLTPSSWMMKRQGTCVATPSGRNVRVDMSVNPRKNSKCDTPIKLHEVVVNGYEKNKYNLWSEWNEWGPCSTTCGNGLRQRNRTCTNTTSLNCVLPGKTNKRSLADRNSETCNLEPCFQSVYQWTIGGVGGAFVLTLFGIVFWYRKFKMIRYFEGLRPNPNFELDPNKTLLEQIEELPYDLHWEFPRYDIRFGSMISEGHFGRVWLAKAKGIRAFNPRDRSDLSSRAKLAKLQDQRVHDYFTTVTESWLLGDCDTTHHYDVAVKTLKECATRKHEMDLASELKLLIHMDRHPNIVNLLASCTIRGDLWVILEYCDHGSLKTFLSDRRKLFTPLWSKNSVDMSTEICFFDLLQMTEQIVKGVMFLHSWKVVHRDISARNILVDANFDLKIADFGLARSENFVAPLDDILPIKWSSLESLLRHEYTTKSDIWSVAVLFWEVFSFGEVPYPGMSSKEVIQQLKEGYRMRSPDHCPDEIWNIISDCWSADPDHRPSAMELFEQLDEVKVLVCSAQDGQYYGTTGSEYAQAGTVQGPSLEEIREGKENMGFEGEEYKSSTKDAVEEGGSSTISYEQYRKVESENYRLRKEILKLKKSEKINKSISEETKSQDKRLINIKDTNDKDTENNNEISKNMETTDTEDDKHTIDNAQAVVHMNTIELTYLPKANIEVDVLGVRDAEDAESSV